MAPLNILIVGCSIAGPTLASFLLLSPIDASQKPHITILERASAPRAQGQNVDVRGIGAVIIRKLGINNLVRAATTGEEGVQLVDGKNRVWAQYAADKTGQVQTPTSDVEILRGRLAQICWKNSVRVSDEVEKEGGRGIDYIFGDRLESLEQDGERVVVRFAKSKEERSFDLVVGADGLQSSTRTLAWGESGEKDRLYRFHMYGAFFSMPRGETDTMWRRWYHLPGRRSMMIRPDKQGNRTTAFMSVVNKKDKRLQEVALKGYKGVQEQKQLMKEYFLDAGWESERILREMMATDDFYYDLVGQVRMDGWSRGRVVLLGDAGYCASPISGMGTTLALNGAYTLAAALTQHPRDHAAAFAQYEEKMRPLVDRAQERAPKLPRIMYPETQWGVWLLRAIVGFLSWAKFLFVIFKIRGPPADVVTLEEYEFKQLPELTE